MTNQSHTELAAQCHELADRWNVGAVDSVYWGNRSAALLKQVAAALESPEREATWERCEACNGKGDSASGRTACGSCHGSGRVASTPSPQAEEQPLSDERGPIISAYTITEGINGIKVERAQQMEGPAKWAVRKTGCVLSRSGEWDWEPMPSSRTGEWIAEFRFDSADKAIAAAQAIVTKEST